MSSAHMSRRDFLRSSAVIGAATTFAVPAVVRAKSLGDKLRIALIGVGGQGAAQLDAAGALENVAALCDVDGKRLGAAAEKYPKAKTFIDFRKMLAEMDKSIDAVMVSTPDHTHAPASALAMQMGKHCYCEKPLTHSVYETRMLSRLAREKNLVTQMGTQIHAGENYHRVVELIRAGVIGPVTKVLVWNDVTFGNVKRPADTPPSPKELDWDLWLGPAPYRPYHPCYVPFHWRNWWSFGTGGIGDLGCHYIDLPFWALDLRHPISVEAVGPPVDAEIVPTNLKVTYQFPARGDQPPLELSWCDGIRAATPEIPPGYAIPIQKAGILFVGQNGLLRADYDSHELYPTEKFSGFKAPEPTLPRSIGHHKEFFEACKTGAPTSCNFDYSGALTETVLLGTVAYRVGKKLDWDAARLKATNCPEADQYLVPQYREGWVL